MFIVVIVLGFTVAYLALKTDTVKKEIETGLPGTSTGTEVIADGLPSDPGARPSIPSNGATDIPSPATAGGNPATNDTFRFAHRMRETFAQGAGAGYARQTMLGNNSGVLDPIASIQQRGKQLSTGANDPVATYNPLGTHSTRTKF